MKVEIACIIDRSGSMGTVTESAISGFNQFLKEQKELPGEAVLSLFLFDDEYLTLHDGVPIADVPELTTKTYVPRAMTALNDAIGKTVTTIGERLSNAPEEQRPDKVIIVILTDGLENASKEYSREKISEMIKHQEDVYSWEFIYLAANQDAFAVGATLGIRKENIANYISNKKGTSKAFATASARTAGYRS